jgi:hypothetical protein
MTLGAVNGFACTRMRVQVPAWGAWWVDADLVEPQALAGRVTVTLADLTLSGTIVSGGVAEGRASYRIVAGAGGWGRTLGAKAYTSDALVKISTVIGDAAREAGETLGALPTTRMGPHYARTAGIASATLNSLAPRAWYVDFAGVTQLGARAATAYTGDGTRTKIDPAGRIVEVATETLAALVPGVQVDGALPATDVEYDLDAKRLTARVYSAPRTTRRLDALARIFEALFPDLKYRGTYEFRVVTQDGERLNLQPVRAATGMPDLARVPVRPGMAGLRANVALGSLVLVTFVDADPSRPVVVAHDAPDAPGWMPLTLELGGPGALGVARVTDAIAAGTLSFAPGPPAALTYNGIPVTVGTPIVGTVSAGSARIKAVL